MVSSCPVAGCPVGAGVSDWTPVSACASCGKLRRSRPEPTWFALLSLCWMFVGSVQPAMLAHSNDTSPRKNISVSPRFLDATMERSLPQYSHPMHHHRDPLSGSSYGAHPTLLCPPRRLNQGKHVVGNRLHFSWL